MRRRDFITLIGGTAAAWPLTARAQQPGMPVVGVLDISSSEANADRVARFRKGLSETGYVEGRNLAIEFRWANNELDRVPELAADLVRRRVAVIAAFAAGSALAAKGATATIPIVFFAGGDPVQVGLVATLNHPGGNVTGVNAISTELNPKRLGLMHELLPTASRFGLLVRRGNPNSEFVINEAQVAASAMGKHLEILYVGNNSEIDTAFASFVQNRVVAKAATRTIPIVFVTGTDPVQEGLVASLNRPGGNITGVSFLSGLLGAKRLELLRQLVPKATTIGVLVDVIATSAASSYAAKQATSLIPIVVFVAQDPVAAGLVASLARPGGNVTGLSAQQADTAGKRLELLREVVRGLRRLGILVNVGDPGAMLDRREVETAARALNLEVVTSEIRRAEDIASTLDAFKGRVDALYVVAETLVNANRIRINTLAVGARLPTMHGLREWVEAGGLMSYGASFPDLYRRAAELVDKIFRGAKPADIPVDQPTKFDLVINLTTAKAIELTIPESFLLRADEVIE